VVEVDALKDTIVTTLVGLDHSLLGSASGFYHIHGGKTNVPHSYVCFLPVVGFGHKNLSSFFVQFFWTLSSGDDPFCTNFLGQVSRKKS